MLTEEQKAENKRRVYSAMINAKMLLKPGDKIVVTKCPGTKRWAIFDHWDGYWIVSKSGIDDYSASCISKVNGEPVDFCTPLMSDAFIEGLEAYHRGDDLLNENPFDDEDAQHGEWIEGWESGASEVE